MTVVTSSAKPRGPGRPLRAGPLAKQASKEAKQRAAAILEVLAGLRTPSQAAQALGRSLIAYYQLETRALEGLVQACEAKAKGRQPSVATELAALRREHERLQRDLGRQQSLVRLAQRAVGLNPPPAPAAKPAGRKGRKRKPTARALTAAARLRHEPPASHSPSDNGMSLQQS